MSITTDEVKLRMAEHLLELYKQYLYWRSATLADPRPNLPEFMGWLDAEVTKQHAS